MGIVAKLYTLGKVSLPKKITHKPYQSLSEEDRETFEKYPLIGAASLSTTNLFKDAVKIMLSHREKLNGNGYPNKLANHEIPIESKILSMVIDFQELQMGLLTNEKASTKRALEIIIAQKGIDYDPFIVDLFYQEMNLRIL